MAQDPSIIKAYELAKDRFAKWGINTDEVIESIKEIPISMHCWQGDDVSGFENPNGELSGGIQATGNYPGKAKSASELRQDFEKAFSLIPGKKRVNLHAIYLEADKKIERNEIKPEHFKNWVEWAKNNDLGLDFNPTFFSHPYSDDGFTLSHPNKEIRDFWIEHAKASRKVSEYFGKELGTPCVTNIWVPDGFKDVPIDRLSPRERLKESLDTILADKIDKAYNLDAVESKVFGIGSESYVVGSHEFYLAYAVANQTLLCLDAGHFHPTEVISNKISSVFEFIDEILLHVSRPVRWDSDHVVIFDDELKEIAHELIRGNFVNRTYIGLDFFDASINRIAAWVIGTRNMQKALLFAALEPTEQLKKYELDFDFTSRLALLEEMKTYPWAAVWDYYCLTENVPAQDAWLNEIRSYEKDVLAKRS